MARGGEQGGAGVMIEGLSGNYHYRTTQTSHCTTGLTRRSVTKHPWLLYTCPEGVTRANGRNPVVEVERWSRCGRCGERIAYFRGRPRVVCLKCLHAIGRAAAQVTPWSEPACLVCQADLGGKYSTAKTCSPRCRQILSRARALWKRMMMGAAGKHGLPKSLDDVHPLDWPPRRASRGSHRG